MKKINTPDKPGGGTGYDVITDSLRQAGKSAGEIDSISSVDTAQEAASEGRIEAGPVVESFMGDNIDPQWFACQADLIRQWHKNPVRAVLDASIARGKELIDAGAMFDENGKVCDDAILALGTTGFWGLPIPVEYGGSDASMFFCMRAITQMSARTHPILGGLLSIMDLIGLAGPLIWRGTPEQKRRWLPRLASGELKSFFAATEPGVGCWITNVKTEGKVKKDFVEVTGEKLFISNAWWGHAGALFLKIDGVLKVLIVELPKERTPEFHIVDYRLHALKPIHNKGLWFKKFCVPVIDVIEGDGLSIIFHDLDRGRPAVAAGAAARMRRILQSCLPWVEGRVTFNAQLKDRQFTRENMALIAAYIVGADALVDWSSSLTDMPEVRGDVPAMIAKTVATDFLREVSTTLGMFVHGGRFVLEGSEIGDWLADDAVASVYEGPNPMLAMATIKAMAKPFAIQFVKPFIEDMLAVSLDPTRIRVGKISQLVSSFVYLFQNRKVLFANRKTLWPAAGPLLKWMLKTEFTFSDNRQLAGLDPVFQDHLNFARAQFIKWRKTFYRNVMVYQEKLGDEQLLMMKGLYKPLSEIVTMLAVIMRARQALATSDKATVAAAHLLCMKLRADLTGDLRISGQYKKAVKNISDCLLEPAKYGVFHQLDGVPAAAILQPYDELTESGKKRAPKK